MTTTGGVGIFTDAISGGDRVWLDSLGITSSLVYSKCYSGGDREADWQMVLSPTFTHRAVEPGRLVGLCRGASIIWNGYLDNPVRGSVWQMKAIGAAGIALQYSAIAPTSGNALNLSEVIAAANTRGLGWNVVGTLPTLPAVAGVAPTAQSGSIQIGAALDQVGSGQTVPQFWSVDRYGNFTMGPAPTTVGYILLATDTGGGRTLANFVTDAAVVYQSATGVLSTVVRSAASRPFGRFEVTVDQTGLGLIATSQADAFGDSYIAKNGARAKFTQPFTATKGQLLTAQGTPTDLALGRPGVLTSVILTDPDSAGDISPLGTAKVLMGETSYDVDAGVLTLTPFDIASPDDTEGLFAS